ncbi:hypothetical protein SGRIM128S_02018 [Streptomyces griseomycini]
MALLARAREAREALSAAQLDAVPPQALATEHDNAEDRTSVIPRADDAPAAARQRGRRARRHGGPLRLGRDQPHQPAGGSPACLLPVRGLRLRRGPLTVVVAVLLVDTVGEGRLKLIDANDAKDVVGAHKDRRANIGPVTSARTRSGR